MIKCMNDGRTYGVAVAVITESEEVEEAAGGVAEGETEVVAAAKVEEAEEAAGAVAEGEVKVRVTP